MWLGGIIPYPPSPSLNRVMTGVFDKLFLFVTCKKLIDFFMRVYFEIKH